MFNKLSLVPKAARQLGLPKTLLYVRYKLTLLGRYMRWRLPAGGRAQPQGLTLQSLGIPFPSRADVATILDRAGEQLLREADEICAGQVRLFGGEPVELNLTPPGELRYWMKYWAGQFNGQDIKWTWEPGRFGWAAALARSDRLSREAKHGRAFWKYTEEFLDANPPNLGPHWVSAQEVALRLINLVFAVEVLAKSKETTPERKARLAQAIAQHAERIPPTLTYARAQNNNHLLTEALGLYTAGIVLPDHPQAEKWRKLGWKWFNRALQTQITPDGAYIQHSANYHRLMLQAALWGAALAKGRGDELPEKTRARLAAATHWLLSLVDHDTGRVPNLGPNDGAYILPFSAQPFYDYRPVLQAASRAFLGEAAFPDGPWDEMSLWFGGLQAEQVVSEKPDYSHRLEGRDSWAYFRAAKFSDRPGHADQLHVDLWWRGLNIAQDAGTYLYNADPPWDNALAGTGAHNTVTVEGRDQMTRAGRFLWLDWAQAQVAGRKERKNKLSLVFAHHNGYRRLGISHLREVQFERPERWLVTDTLAGKPSAKNIQARLYWLLPDWPWELEGSDLRIKSLHGWVSLSVDVGELGGTLVSVQLARAGEMLKGEGEIDPIQGWLSPTYGYKQPALSFAVDLHGNTPLQIISTWQFPE